MAECALSQYKWQGRRVPEVSSVLKWVPKCPQQQGGEESVNVSLLQGCESLAGMVICVEWAFTEQDLQAGKGLFT